VLFWDVVGFLFCWELIVINKIKMSDWIEKFIETFKPGENLTTPDEQTLKLAEESVLPKELITLWKKYGFGNYGNGIIKVINPFEYANTLYTWLGGEDKNKLPILISGFGDIFYYRKITDEDDDVSLLDIHYRRIDVCSYSFYSFMKSFIVNKEIYEEALKKPLFTEALEKLGELTEKEIYLFAPALAFAPPACSLTSPTALFSGLPSPVKTFINEDNWSLFIFVISNTYGALS